MYLNFTIRVLTHLFFSHIVLLTKKLNNCLSRVNDFMLCSNSQEKIISSHMVLFSWPTAIAYLQVSYYATFHCQEYFPTQDTPRYTPLCMPVRSLSSYTCSISHKFECIIVSRKRSMLLNTVCIIYLLHTTTSTIYKLQSCILKIARSFYTVQMKLHQCLNILIIVLVYCYVLKWCMLSISVLFSFVTLERSRCAGFIIMIYLYLLSHYCEVYMYYHLENVMKLHYLETILPLSKCSFIACNPIHTCNYTILSYHLYTEVILCMRNELIYYCICLLVMYCLCLYTHLFYNALYFVTRNRNNGRD